MWYDIYYKGTPPQRQRFTIRSDGTSTNIRIKFPKAGAFILRDSKGALIPRNDWDKNISQPGVIKETKCGENRYIGVVNILEFHMNAGCTVFVEMTQSI